MGENYSANKLLAWIKVEAKNVETNEDAEVKFTILEGNLLSSTVLESIMFNLFGAE